MWGASWLRPLAQVPGEYQGRRCDFPSSICRASGSALTGRPSLAPGAALGRSEVGEEGEDRASSQGAGPPGPSEGRSFKRKG